MGLLNFFKQKPAPIAIRIPQPTQSLPIEIAKAVAKVNESVRVER
jgi:hypothetical protein